MEKLSYKQFHTLAQKHFCEGGRAYSWWAEDRFEDDVKEHGPMTRERLMEMFREAWEQERQDEEDLLWELGMAQGMAPCWNIEEGAHLRWLA